MLNELCLKLSRFFGVLMIVIDMKLGKAILKISLVISPRQLMENVVMLDLSWMEKLIIGGEITIDYVDIGLSCKISFILGMLHSFIHLSQIAENPMLSKSSSLRYNQSSILTAKVEIDPKASVIAEPNVLDRAKVRSCC